MSTFQGSPGLEGFLAIEKQLTAALAASFEERLAELGDDVMGITWFSSQAHEYAAARMPLAA